MSSLFVSFVPRVAARVANIVKVMLLFYLFFCSDFFIVRIRVHFLSVVDVVLIIDKVSQYTHTHTRSLLKGWFNGKWCVFNTAKWIPEGEQTIERKEASATREPEAVMESSQ